MNRCHQIGLPLLLVVLAIGCTKSHNEDTPPIEDALDQLGVVREVEVFGERTEPQHTIIHIRDRAFLMANGYEADKYDQYIEDLAAFQSEQTAVVRHLIKNENIRVVYKDGLTEKTAMVHEAQMKVVYDVYEKQVEETKAQVAAGDDSLPTKISLESFERLYHRAELRLGIAGQLWHAGELMEVRGAEDSDTFQITSTTADDANGEDGPNTNPEREDGLVKRLLTDSHPVTVVLLDGRVDLHDNLPPGIRLIVVTVDSYARATIRDE